MKNIPASLRPDSSPRKGSNRGGEDELTRHPSAGGKRGMMSSYGVLIALCLLLIVACLLPAIKVCLQSIALLLECNGTRPPRVLQPVLDTNLITEQVTIPAADGQTINATLYTPTSHLNAPGLVIVHGLDAGGMRSLLAYGQVEASTGLRVLIPDIAPLKSYSVGNVNLSDVNIIGASTQWLAHRTGRPVSLMGISFGGGLALVAAARKENAPNVKLVFDVGGYDDLSRVANFYVNGTDEGPKGENTKVRPNRWASYFLEYTDLVMLGTPEDIAALQPILKDRIINAAHHPRHEKEIISGLVAKLTPEEARKLNAILSDNKLDFAEIFQKTKPQLEEVSPHGNLEGLTAPVYILHGMYDDVIPSEEALWLEKDLPAGRLKMVLVTPLVSHVALKGSSVTWKDKWSLLYFMYKVHYAELEPYAASTHGREVAYTAIGSMAALMLCILVVLGYVLLGRTRMLEVK